MLLSKCSVCNSKKSKFLKFLCQVLFCFKKYKLDRIINKFLSAGDLYQKFIQEIHFRQPGFTQSACGPFTNNKVRIKKIKETGDSRYIYQNELDKACLEHDMAYEDSKDLNGRKAADKILHDKALKLLKIRNMMDINVYLLQGL